MSDKQGGRELKIIINSYGLGQFYSQVKAKTIQPCKSVFAIYLLWKIQTFTYWDLKSYLDGLDGHVTRSHTLPTYGLLAHQHFLYS